jgi:hypothetical protein
MVICRWFLFCENPAEGVEEHPILGDVPICQPCRAKLVEINLGDRVTGPTVDPYDGNTDQYNYAW